jgi:hypothetical protein
MPLAGVLEARFQEEPAMREENSFTTESVAFIEHLVRFPEDLRDIRRLQRRFGLSVAEVAVALDCWRRREETAQGTAVLAH